MGIRYGVTRRTPIDGIYDPDIILKVVGKGPKAPFIPILIGIAEFANDTRFQIDQVNAKGGCRITDLNTKKYSHSGSVQNAWKSVRYQAQIVHRTENTTGWRG